MAAKPRPIGLAIACDGRRLTLVGTQFDRRRLESVRDNLRHELAGDTPQPVAHERRE